MNPCLHIIVKGRVQGVYFRVFTQKQARKLNIKGYTRNLPEGHVEIFAIGDVQSLQALKAWCHKGPALAKVTEVIANQRVTEEIFDDFYIR